MSVVAIVLAVGLISAGLAAWFVSHPAASDIARFDMTPANQTIMSNSPSVTVAPDGKSVAYLVGGSSTVGGELRLRSLNRLEPAILVSGNPVASPFFSPDGLQIGFYENFVPRMLKRVSIQGGTASSITELPATLRGASWGGDGTIIYATTDTTSGLWRPVARERRAEDRVERRLVSALFADRASPLRSRRNAVGCAVRSGRARGAR